MTDIGFEKDDADFLLDAYGRITSDTGARSLFESAVGMYDKKIDCGFSALFAEARKAGDAAGVREYTSNLLAMLCLSKRAREYYLENSIPEEIWLDSMRDLKYKLDECRIIKGYPGNYVPSWTALFFKLRLFGLGRLQFEFTQFGRFFSKGSKSLRPVSGVIKAHIPRTGTKLDPAECDASFERALKFFEQDIGKNPAAACDSWLLFPKNRDFLKPGSNMLDFMDRFDLVEWSFDGDLEGIDSLFETDERDPEKLVAETSLQKAYKEYFLNGGKFGRGYGVFFY
ncbi:MAG: DUF5596 domain-containing protein [Clostridia bacterium]|nr:DUF5596 domain-containing protein [Clostridia bacterium]